MELCNLAGTGSDFWFLIGPSLSMPDCEDEVPNERPECTVCKLGRETDDEVLDRWDTDGELLAGERGLLLIPGGGGGATGRLR